MSPAVRSALTCALVVVALAAGWRGRYGVWCAAVAAIVIIGTDAWQGWTT